MKQLSTGQHLEIMISIDQTPDLKYKLRDKLNIYAIENNHPNKLTLYNNHKPYYVFTGIKNIVNFNWVELYLYRTKFKIINKLWELE